jgi:hypothetical protein
METVQGPLMDVASDVGQPLQAVAGHDCGALQYKINRWHKIHYHG